ncbi:neuronal acetylcholine receptor subunit beta-3-like [Dermacentor andersoni]|uniref:neuronal acetylcholine receptor subunit beta-3-like n=1 Tax=Dermacentor andersoni TaxID=34620 RepID=UPI002154FDF4|nr:neuronal acetylcholine receptor subunit beta-3-like [Dermacentor andersoni]
MKHSCWSPHKGTASLPLFAFAHFKMSRDMLLRKVYITCVLFGSLHSCVGSGDSDLNRITHHRNLLKHLFDPERYTNDIRPVFYHTNVTVLTLDLLIQEIADMDHSRQTVKVNVIISAKWRDEFLTWKPDDYGGQDFITVPAEKIWVPEIAAMKDLSSLLTSSPRGGSYGRPMARVDASGSVSLDHLKQLPASCVATPEGFWSSRYDCQMVVHTWDIDGREVRLQGNVRVDVEDNPAWEVSQPRVKILFHAAMGCQMVLRKRYEPSLACPTVAVVLLTLATFWLPTTGPRVTLCCANFLVAIIWLSTLTEYHAGSISTAPHVVFLSLSATLAAVSLAWAVATHKLLHSADRCEAPRGLVHLLETPFWQFLCVGGFQPASAAAARETEMEHLSHDPPMAAEVAAPASTNQEPRLREEWHAVSRAVDRALFVAFVVSFISFRLVFGGPHWGASSRVDEQQ